MSQNELNFAAIRDIFTACQLRDASNQCNCTGTKVREKSNQIKSSRKIIKMIHCNFVKTDTNKNKQKMHAYNLCRNCMISEQNSGCRNSIHGVI